jgi:DNA (cytosine-5)-methyltransferase 1
MRIGGLFSGYGGLEMAAQSVFGGTVAWHSEIDPAASKILAHHWPDVPNLGDITKVDWSQVEPVDVLTGGSPCQDVSAAGKRAGMRAGTRSGLWAAMTDAIDALRPPIMVWENVRGVLSAEADSALEPCAGCVGDVEDGTVLRALGRVLGDLADIGYDTQRHGLRAADVGAPHGRFRVFVVATDTRSETVGLGTGLREGEPARIWWRRSDNHNLPLVAPHTDHSGPQGWKSAAGRHLSDGCAVADTARDGWDEGRTESAGVVGGSNAALSGDAATDPDRDGQQSIRRLKPVRRDLDGRGSADTAWGDYEPAIRRWEHVLGRFAPEPTELAPKGGRRLSPAFVEWMMGLPAGHVTAVPGVSRNDQLKALGNGVVPQQGAAAIRLCIDHAERAA